MRVLWLSPWLRPLARIRIDALSALGVRSLLVTSARHPEVDDMREDEVLVEPRPRTPSSWPACGRALVEARRFRPDVVVTELVRDPRWFAFGALAPTVEVIHDDVPHDHFAELPRWRRAVAQAWRSRSSAVVVHSAHVARELVGQGVPTSHIVPLSSDFPDARVPSPVDAARRRDFVLLGRMYPYKNIDVVLRAWERHRAGDGYRGDRLFLIGDGPYEVALPPGVERSFGAYRYRDVVPVLAGAKASLVFYRTASQSGTQVLSMQLGTHAIRSAAGGLAEYGTPDERDLDPDDDVALADELDELADPASAARRGAAARKRYQTAFGADVAASSWLDVLRGVGGP